jgi:subtilisin family serine protease
MARKLIGVLVSGLALAAPGMAHAGLRSVDWNDQPAPSEVLVRYKAGVDAGERREVRSAAGVEFESALELPHTQVVSVDGSRSDAIARLEDQPEVLYAQPNYVYHAFAAAPNDTHFGQLWGLGGTPGVGALPAWDRSRGAGQVIAVVDTGVDLTHPDLAGNLWTGAGGIHGHDFVDNDDDPSDLNLHGTHVAGTAAAIADNGQGIAGVAPQAQIMAVRVLNQDGSGNSSQIANGIAFAANNGASVINLSLGGPGGGGGDQAMSDAIALAEQKNTVVVAAAGNDNNNNDANPVTPCTLPNANLICVAAVTSSGDRASFSNFGATTVDVGAPGGDGDDPGPDILSAKPSFRKVFSDGFEGTIGQWTASGTGQAWGIANVGLGSGPFHSATDSPGTGTFPGPDYDPDTSSQLQRNAPVDLSGKRGCRLDFFVMLDNEDVAPDGTPFDFVGVGVVSGAGQFGRNFSAHTVPGFRHVDFSIPGVDGQSDVKPTLRFTSDGSIQADGAYVEDINIACRSNVYDDVIAGEDAADEGSYTAISGTSMASPHVAGVAALVRAVDPGAPPSQVVQALKNGAKPVPGMQGATVTGGAVDAVASMDAALAIPNTPPPTKPRKPRVLSVKVSRKGVITLVVQGDVATSGKVTLTANILAARVKTVGKKSFRIGSSGRAKVKVKPNRAALKQLRRKHKLKLKVKIVSKNAAGLSNSATGSITLTFRRR